MFGYDWVRGVSWWPSPRWWERHPHVPRPIFGTATTTPLAPGPPPRWERRPKGGARARPALRPPTETGSPPAHFTNYQWAGVANLLGVRNDGISRRPIELLLVATMLVVVAVACCDKGPKIPTASFIGTVTINGTPVANVEVAFHPVETI